MTSERDQAYFWRNFFRAIGASSIDFPSVRGASGMSYSIVAAGIDFEHKRLIIVSGEHDARAAAMAQIDIQYSLPEQKVLVVRPVAINLGEIAQGISQAVGKTLISPNDIHFITTSADLVKDIIESKADQIARVFKSAPLNSLAQWAQVIQQLAMLEFVTQPDQQGSSLLRLDKLMELDPVKLDTDLGICAVPLYSFSGDDFETVLNGSAVEAIKALLHQRGILQFFFPAPDTLALGLIDRVEMRPVQISEELVQVPQLGHIYSQPEIVSEDTSLPEIIDVLQERGLVAQGKISIEITAEGRRVKQTVKFRPNESLVSRIVNRFSFVFDLKDIFKSFYQGP